MIKEVTLVTGVTVGTEVTGVTVGAEVTEFNTI